MSGRRQLGGPTLIVTLTSFAAHAVEGVHPFRQVVEILTILFPLELRIRRLMWLALIQRFADAQATDGSDAALLLPRITR